LLEGYHRKEYARCAEMNRIPILLISLWLEGQKIEYEELLQLKQLCNYTEAQHQNDSIKRLFFLLKIQVTFIF
jgi:hypothetical protein